MKVWVFFQNGDIYLKTNVTSIFFINNDLLLCSRGEYYPELYERVSRIQVM